MPWRGCIFSLWNNNFIHVVESPCGLVVKRKCIYLYHLQYCNIACVLDSKPLLLIVKGSMALLLLYIIINNLSNYVLPVQCFYFVSCLVSLHGDQCNKCTAQRRVSPRYYTVDPTMLLPSGNPFKCHEDILYLQPMIPPTKRFDISPPDWGMLRRSRCVQIFLEKQ